MKSFATRHKTVTACAVLAAFLLTWYLWAVSLGATRGRLAAKWDTSHGDYEILAYGLADPSRSTYAKLLQTRYGIRYHTVAGCIVSQSLIDYVAAYNNVSVTEIKRKFGPDALKSAQDEANLQFKTDVLAGGIH